MTLYIYIYMCVYIFICVYVYRYMCVQAFEDWGLVSRSLGVDFHVNG